eukprot:6269638-Prymnesium_polylepis.1
MRPSDIHTRNTVARPARPCSTTQPHGHASQPTAHTPQQPWRLGCSTPLPPSPVSVGPLPLRTEQFAKPRPAQTTPAACCATPPRRRLDAPARAPPAAPRRRPPPHRAGPSAARPSRPPGPRRGRGVAAPSWPPLPRPTVAPPPPCARPLRGAHPSWPPRARRAAPPPPPASPSPAA